jgi:hypothetical protein
VGRWEKEIEGVDTLLVVARIKIPVDFRTGLKKKQNGIIIDI